MGLLSASKVLHNIKVTLFISLQLLGISVLQNVSAALRSFKLKYIPYPMLPEALKFVRDGGDSLMHRSVDRGRPAHLYIFGGYKGASAQAWMNVMSIECLDIFEPVPAFASILTERFSHDPVTVHEFGVGREASERVFVISDDATAAVDSGRGVRANREEAEVRVVFRAASELTKVFDSSAGYRVLEVNIEGGEYELISALGSLGILERFHDVFIQFHYVGKDTDRLFEECRRQLTKSHTLMWSYPFVWEHWRLALPGGTR